MIEPQQETQRSSVKITENAKHETQVEVKIYDGATEDEIERIRGMAVDAFKETRQELQT